MQAAISHTENLQEVQLDQAAATLAITATAPEAVSLVEVTTTAVHLVARTILIPEAAAEVLAAVQAVDHFLLVVVVVILEVAALLVEGVVPQVAVTINKSFFGTKSVI